MPVQDWSAVADENTSIDGINIAEHCPAKNMNNAIRSVMAALNRLPNLMGKVPWGSSTQIGIEIEAGLPEIAGAVDGVFVWGESGVGAFLDSVKENSSGFTENSSNHQWRTLNFKASNSNVIYGKSGTVQPPALCLLPCIRYE